MSIAEDESEDEQERCEKFCSLDAAGTERFGQSENAEQAQTDKLVLQHFIETDEKRKNGLADNKAKAQRRLVGLWNSLRKNPDTLQKYDEVFQDQYRNILEYVPEEESDYKNLHDSPDQTVITPHKTTTKLSVVCDASAHYKNRPSLNDSLQRGPVISPQFFEVSLREKHKLQVRHNKSISHPQKHDCVLITDPVQPRHSSKMGRITELLKSKDGQERKAVVILQSEKQTRRPVNLPVPLKLEDGIKAETTRWPSLPRKPQTVPNETAKIDRLR
ncbi:unnamed protein product [Cylicostephanus goldi]|uniref:Uncharacterized protein n=1 Tax=Cylicostephanus goldi TaxID=71465 RepID=A0A3P6T0A1_CYLGO|nr:unnamed protein product [Cylicostephanus goldi]